MQDHVIKGSCDFMEEKSSLYVTTRPGLVTIGIVVVEVYNFDLSRGITEHMFRALYDFRSGRLS